MAAKRKPRLPAFVPPKSNGDNGYFVDRVTIGTSKKAIEGYEIVERNGKATVEPAISVVMSGRAPSRMPYDYYNPPNPKNVIELNPGVGIKPLGKKYCSHCGEWVRVEGFSEDKRNRDGLQSHCKSCRAEHARYLYWQQKNTDAPPQILAA